MHMLRLLVQKPHTRPTTPSRDSRPPRALLEITTWGTSGGIWSIVFQGETDNHLPLGTANYPG